jgi:hypothetical protein
MFHLTGRRGKFALLSTACLASHESQSNSLPLPLSLTTYTIKTANFLAYIKNPIIDLSISKIPINDFRYQKTR